MYVWFLEIEIFSRAIMGTLWFSSCASFEVSGPRFVLFPCWPAGTLKGLSHISFCRRHHFAVRSVWGGQLAPRCFQSARGCMFSPQDEFSPDAAARAEGPPTPGGKAPRHWAHAERSRHTVRSSFTDRAWHQFCVWVSGLHTRRETVVGAG